MQTIKFFTVGCKVNQYETQMIREKFIRAGFKELENSQPADIYIINTCTVTHKADRDSRRLIYQAHGANPQATIAVTGCYTELDSDEIAKIPGVTYIIKNSEKNRIVGLLQGLSPSKLCLSLAKEIVPERGISFFKGHTRAFVKIQDGCNNFCSYCKVSLVRGRSRSKSLNEIIQEAKELVKNGFKEIVLCGICLGSYGEDLEPRTNLLDLTSALENIEGLLRIRLSSIEGGDVSDELINKIAQSKKLCRHLHIPIQSGDDEILKKMNRKYCRDDYCKLIKRIKIQIPEMAITTDCLVGFPGESEVNFQNTVNLIKEILPLKVHIFPYSRRKGTPAADNFKYEVNQVIIKERILRLKSIADACAQEYKKQFLDTVKDVLIEDYSHHNFAFWEGHTDNYLKVLVKSNQNLKNQPISLRLKKIDNGYLLADFADST